MGGLGDVSRETKDALLAYLSLLKEWQERLNLVSRETLRDAWTRHMVDSAQLSLFLRGEEKSRIADLGTGAGFPGMVLALLGYENVTLFESNYKKCTFLREVRRKLQVRVEIFEGRLETYEGLPFDWVVSRALSSLPQLLDYAHPLLKEGGSCLFLKGKEVDLEIKEAQKQWLFRSQKKESITSPEGTVLLLEGIERRPV